MNMIGTLGKVAMGVMVARGIGKMLSKRNGADGGQLGSGGGSGGGGLGDLLGGALGGGSASGGLGGVLGSVLGGGQSRGAAAGGGGGGLLGGVLGSVLGGAMKGGGGSTGGGLGDLLGKATGGGLGGALGNALGGEGKRDSGLGGLLDSLGGGGASAQQQGGSLGELLNSALNGQSVAAQPTEEEKAEVLLRAMLMACKADGEIDEREEQRISKHLGDVSAEEAEYVRSVMRAPVDIDALARDTPDDMAQQVYMMSVLAIDLDEQSEAQYLHKLAQALNVSQSTSNAIHEKLGVPTLYS